MNDIWVFVEVINGSVTDVSLELISKASSIAAGRRVCALLAGWGILGESNSLIHAGADHVYLIEDRSLEFFDVHRYGDILIGLAEKYKPEIFLLGGTLNGRSLAPYVAAGLKTGLTADCTDLEIDGETLLLKQTRPAFGGNLMAQILCPHKKPQMATVRPGVFEYIKKKDNRGLVKRLEVPIPRSRVIVLDRINENREKPGICDAPLVVSAGMGMGSRDNLNVLREFAGLIGARMGGSRAVVDAGWIEREYQVGQSGSNITCDVYIACGISGAVQHMAGLKPLTTIIAINTDGDAPIMKAANYSIKGDAVRVLDAFISKYGR